jgi:hypothetical protein
MKIGTHVRNTPKATAGGKMSPGAMGELRKSRRLLRTLFWQWQLV